MTILTFKAGRLVLRRTGHGKQQLLNSAKQRQKSSATTSPPNGSSTIVEAKTVPTPNSLSPLPLWQRLGPLSTIFAAYGKSQRTRPYTTQLCSSLVIYLCGDLAAQTIGDEDYNPLRTVRNMIIGGICSIPSYKWYLSCNISLPARSSKPQCRFIYLGLSFNYRSALLSLATKVLVNQVLFTPIFNSYFFGMQSLLSGDGILGAWERIKKTVPVSFVNSCKLWPAVTAFSFTYVPAQYRSLFAGEWVNVGLEGRG
jgi:protein Mpv17